MRYHTMKLKPGILGHLKTSHRLKRSQNFHVGKVRIDVKWITVCLGPIDIVTLKQGFTH